jgi:hypothetical protein
MRSIPVLSFLCYEPLILKENREGIMPENKP